VSSEKSPFRDFKHGASEISTIVKKKSGTAEFANSIVVQKALGHAPHMKKDSICGLLVIHGLQREADNVSRYILVDG